MNTIGFVCVVVLAVVLNGVGRLMGMEARDWKDFNYGVISALMLAFFAYVLAFSFIPQNQ